MARKMQQMLFGFTLFVQCAIALSSSSEHSLFHLAPSTETNSDGVKQLAMYYMSQTVTESDSFTVKDVIYDIGSNGMKTAAHVRLERFYQGIQVLGGD